MNFAKKQSAFNLAAKLTVILTALCFFTDCVPKEIIFGKAEIEKQEKLSTEKTEEAIKNSIKLKELDDLCGGIPRPESSKEAFKDFSIGVDFPDNSKQSISITHWITSKKEFYDVQEIFLNHFERKGWTRLRDKEYGSELRFQKNDLYVHITGYGQYGTDNYSFGCKKIEPKN